MKGVEADVYEFCDSRRTPAHIEAWLADSSLTVGPKATQKMLDGFLEKRLMVEEHGWHLSLALKA